MRGKICLDIFVTSLAIVISGHRLIVASRFWPKNVALCLVAAAGVCGGEEMVFGQGVSPTFVLIVRPAFHTLRYHF